MEGRQRAQVTFGTEALVTTQVPSSLWRVLPTHPAILSPLSHSWSQSARLVVLWALGAHSSSGPHTEPVLWPSLRCGWWEAEVLGTLGSPGPQAWVVWCTPVHVSCRGCWFRGLYVVCMCGDRETSVQPANTCLARSLMARCSLTLGRRHQVRVGA